MSSHHSVILTPIRVPLTTNSIEGTHLPMGVLHVLSEPSLDQLIATAQADPADDTVVMNDIIRRFEPLVQTISRSRSADPHVQHDLAQEARLGLVLRNATDESRLQEQLIEAEKKGSLGVLTAGIGHELNNPLFGILGLGEAIQHEPDSEQIKQYAKDIVQHGKRMAGIIRDFAGVTRADTGDRRGLVDLARLLDSAIRLVQQSMGGWEIEVEKRYGSLPPVNAVAEDLLQAFVNVILNAAQAIKVKGCLTITAERGPVLLQITIKDSGPGISKPHLLKLFDPFFTTKQQGQGSGLGLTIARRLLMKNGGHIRMESTPGQGASCIITFPIPQEAARTEGKG